MNFWIFQSRPDQYDLSQELREGREEQWLATRYREYMAPGDIVFFWMSGDPGRRGIYGRGKLISLPVRDEEGYGVRVKYEERYPAAILAQKIAANPELRDLQILKIPIGTNFKINRREAYALGLLAEDNQIIANLAPGAF